MSPKALRQNLVLNALVAAFRRVAAVGVAADIREVDIQAAVDFPMRTADLPEEPPLVRFGNTKSSSQKTPS